MLRIAALMAVLALLLERGVEPGRLLGEFGLTASDFEDPETLISMTTMGTILARCAQEARCPFFGLLAGERIGASALGAVGFLVQSSPDVRTALNLLAVHYRAHNPWATIGLTESESFVSLSYTISRAGIGGSEHILDGAMAIAWNIMRALCGVGWLPAEVRFAHTRPADVEPFRNFFRADLVFDAEVTALVFADRWLDKPLSTSDPLLHRMMSQRVGQIEADFGGGIAGELHRMLRDGVTNGDASVTAVASRVGVRTRTLNRRLAAEGTSFVQLRDEARYAAACRLLENTRMPVSQIGYHLGYANASGFTRAFRRWSGMDPSKWRASGRTLTMPATAFRPRGSDRE